MYNIIRIFFLSVYFILDFLKSLRKSLGLRICYTSSEDLADSDLPGVVMVVLLPILHFVCCACRPHQAEQWGEKQFLLCLNSKWSYNFFSLIKTFENFRPACCSLLGAFSKGNLTAKNISQGWKYQNIKACDCWLQYGTENIPFNYKGRAMSW